jgi:hypothetical protein
VAYILRASILIGVREPASEVLAEERVHDVHEQKIQFTGVDNLLFRSGAESSASTASASGAEHVPAPPSPNTPVPP